MARQRIKEAFEMCLARQGEDSLTLSAEMARTSCNIPRLVECNAFRAILLPSTINGHAT